MLIKVINKFIKLESSAGIVLFIAAIAALIISNSPLSDEYQELLNMGLGIHLDDARFEKNLAWWINDILMVFFFFLVCLEIKWEMVQGELSSASSMALPLIAALGGMLFPALIYMAINWKDPTAYPGWAIPTATDIAFSLGILSLLGKRVPLALKLFLSTIAIFDDLGAIVIIAVFYTNKLSFSILALSLIPLSFLFWLNRRYIQNLLPYLIGGALLWLCFLNAGIHPTLAGVLTAFFIPAHSAQTHQTPMALKLSNKIHPWVAFIILPLFAFANAGVSFTTTLAIEKLFHPIALGIIGGLFLGKQLGIFSATFLAIKLKLCQLPEKMSWMHVYGVALICGIGFTMSLFIGSLAFHAGEDGTGYMAIVRWSVIAGSFFSGLVGYCFLAFSLPKENSNP